MPNQLNADEAANDEPKTYNDEAEGEDGGRDWQESAELDNLKGDLVDEDDGDPRRHSYPEKSNSQAHAETSCRNKDDLGRDIPNDVVQGRNNFPYQQDIGAIVSGLNRPLFPNVSQVPYPPYVPYHHMLFGASAPADIDGKTGIPRPPGDIPPSMYPLPGQLGQIPNPLAPSWSSAQLYPICTGSAMAGVFRYPYPFGISSSGSINNVSPFPLLPPPHHANGVHPGVMAHHGLPLAAPITNGHGVTKPLSDKKNMNSADSAPSKRRDKEDRPSKPYVKKPLNAFMLYMKEQRAKVVAECTLKESAAINQILGRKWHSLSREDQQKYYEMARKERQIHMQMFPGWSARDNYGKRKKRKKEKAQDCTAPTYSGKVSLPSPPPAAAGHEDLFQTEGSSPRRRKKKCVRYQQDGEDSDLDDSDASPHGPQHGSPSAACNPSHLAGNPSQGSSGQQRPQENNNIGIHSLADRLSPNSGSGVPEHIKRERSPPGRCDGDTSCLRSKNGVFLPTASNYMHDTSDVGFSAAEQGPAKASRNLEAGGQPSKSYPASNRLPTASAQTSLRSLGEGGGGERRPSSHTDTILPSTPNMFASSLLSPTSMGLAGPHSDFLSQIPSYLQMSTLAAAASLPASSLGGFMGFPGFKGLSSPVGSGLGPPGSSVAPVDHAGSAGSRRAASALEGKS